MVDGASGRPSMSGRSAFPRNSPFRVGPVFVAVTPCDASNAPATCPAPGFPPNYLGSLNRWTGQISRVPVSGPSPELQGMIFIAR